LLTRDDLLPRDTPELDALILPRGDEAVPIGAEPKRQDALGMGRQTRGLALLAEIPELDGAVRVTRKQEGALRMNAQGSDWTDVSGQHGNEGRTAIDRLEITRTNARRVLQMKRSIERERGVQRPIALE